MAHWVDVQSSVPRLAKSWSRFKSNVENDGPKSYYKRAIGVPFLDDISSQLQDRLQDRNHIDIFALLLSVMSSNNCNIDEATELLFQRYKNEMVNERVHFFSEVRRWLNIWNHKSYQKKQKIDTTQTRVDSKSVYIVPSRQLHVQS